ncbi:MAG: hypothetical protein ACTHU0_28370 [Kofleriaceae bacterium]
MHGHYGSLLFDLKKVVLGYEPVPDPRDPVCDQCIEGWIAAAPGSPRTFEYIDNDEDLDVGERAEAPTAQLECKFSGGYVPVCVVCSTREEEEPSYLVEPGVCPKCGPLRLFRVEQPRVKRVVYERVVWAPSGEVAIEIVKHGSAWPESYDERTIRSWNGSHVSTDVTDDEHHDLDRTDVGLPCREDV